MSYFRTKNKADCCGCSACADICPVGCIKMSEDEDFFKYPVVNKDKCLDCGKCFSACPVLNSEKTKNSVIDEEAFSFVAEDKELIKGSSSGGAFSTIMDRFFEVSNNAVVVGAAFEGTKVRHKSFDNRADAELLKKSKYVQSNADGIYKTVKNDLEHNKMVLFSGTPCMVAALKAFLGKDYDNLTTIDIVCHGVPSQSVFSKYLDELMYTHNSKVVNATFKIKKGFETESPNPRTADFSFENAKTINLDISGSEYLYGFYHNIFLRPSCYNCKFATPERPGDITLGDYWGIEKINNNLNSKNGVSLVRFNTEKGKEFIDTLEQSGQLSITSYEFACDENYQLRKPAKAHRNKDKFFVLLKEGCSVMDAVNICKKPDKLIVRIIRKIKRVLKA